MDYSDNEELRYEDKKCLTAILEMIEEDKAKRNIYDYAILLLDYKYYKSAEDFGNKFFNAIDNANLLASQKEGTNDQQ